MKNKNLVGAAVLAAAALSACAPEVVRQSADLVPSAASPRRLETTRSTEVQLGTGYSRTIAAGTTLAEAGAIPQGRVLRPTNTIFSVEGAHVHEAYAVVQGGRLVGFYLPFERAFSPLPSPVEFPLKESTP